MKIYRHLLLLVASCCGGFGAAQVSQADQNDVIVEGHRDRSILYGGQWRLNLSPSYMFGKTYDPSEKRVTGQERYWRVCIGDVTVETMLVKIIGEGNVAKTGAACSRLVSHIKSGTIRSSQYCYGNTIQTIDPQTHNIVSKPARNTLIVTGKYDNISFVIDFIDSLEPAVFDAATGILGNEHHWSIHGIRERDCIARKP